MQTQHPITITTRRYKSTTFFYIEKGGYNKEEARAIVGTFTRLVIKAHSFYCHIGTADA